jgi:hypothetical protein
MSWTWGLVEAQGRVGVPRRPRDRVSGCWTGQVPARILARDSPTRANLLSLGIDESLLFSKYSIYVNMGGERLGTRARPEPQQVHVIYGGIKRTKP